jgi:6-phosphogluconolactonase
MVSSTTLLVFVSMFAAEPEGGVRAFHLEPATGRLTPAATAPDLPNSFFLASSPDHATLYVLTAKKFGDAPTEEVTAWRIGRGDASLTPLGRQPAAGAVTCYVAPDATGRGLLMAHYNGGTVAMLPLAADGALAGPPAVVPHTCPGSGVVKGRQDGPHPHAIIPAPMKDGGPQFAYAADLGCDAIYRFHIDHADRKLVPLDPPFVKTPPGAGPRHLVFDPSGQRLYCIYELANAIGVYDFDAATGTLTERQVISTLPADFTGTSYTADLRFTPDGRFLYGTNRGHDSLAAYAVGDDGRLTLIEIVPSRGKGPQNIAITPCGTLLLCANMPGDSLAVFRIDRQTGRLTPVGEPVAITKPSAIAIVP